jgi:hypothetical protein
MDRRAERFRARLLWGVLLVGIALNLALISGRVLLYPATVTLPGGFVYQLEPVGMLLLYGGLGWWLTTAMSPARLAALRDGTLFGLVSGAVWIVNLAVETFADLAVQVGGLVFLLLLGATFLLWGVAGLRVARRSGSLSLAILAAVWSAMNSIVILVAFGLLLLYISLPQLEHNIATSPDFLRSGWHDVGAFAIANTFDAGFSHLLMAPLVAVVFGALGALSSKGWNRMRASREQQN